MVPSASSAQSQERENGPPNKRYVLLTESGWRPLARNAGMNAGSPAGIERKRSPSRGRLCHKQHPLVKFRKRQKQKRSSSRDGRLHLAPRCGEQLSKAKHLIARVIREQLWNETENSRMRHVWKISRHKNLSRGKFPDFEVVSLHAESDKLLFVT